MKYFLPKKISKVLVPPIKCQGIKTKLVDFIANNISWPGTGKWIEPFLGSGVVAFNIRPKNAILSDTNKHIINVYKSIQSGAIDENIVAERLQSMGAELKSQGQDYFYSIRQRFNESGDPLDLMFLNRSCFNGVMRFNKKGGYNVPFGKKTERFRRAYVTKIYNQVKWVRVLVQNSNWEFKVQSWQESFFNATSDDFIYVDPPYIGRHADYFNQWSDQDAENLAKSCTSLPCGFALSMWKENKYRINEHLINHWGDCDVRTMDHFYHVGSSESLRNKMIEALAIKKGFASNNLIHINACVSLKETKTEERSLFDN